MDDTFSMLLALGCWVGHKLCRAIIYHLSGTYAVILSFRLDVTVYLCIPHSKPVPFFNVLFLVEWVEVEVNIFFKSEIGVTRFYLLPKMYSKNSDFVLTDLIG